jgi:hypothetical protein
MPGKLAMLKNQLIAACLNLVLMWAGREIKWDPVESAQL